MKNINILSSSVIALLVFVVTTLSLAATHAQSSSRTSQRQRTDAATNNRSARGQRAGSQSKPRGSQTKSSGSQSRSSGSQSKLGGSQSKSGGSQTKELPPLSAEATAALEKMKGIQAAIQNNRRSIDQVFRDMPIGFNASQEEMQQRIDELKLQRIALEQSLEQQCLEVFRLAPLREPLSTSVVLKQLTQSLTPSGPQGRFDPEKAMDISSILMELDEVPWAVLMKVFKASYALHDFDQASQILDTLEEQYGPVKDVYYEVLEETNQAWQDELAIRRQESTTGDLPYAVVETDQGTFKIELFENQAPLTVYDFISRAEAGNYDNQPFFLVKPGVFARAGWSKETGQPANDTISSEAQRPTARKHFSGTVTMVSFDGQTTSSVFQISHQPNLEFNGTHTAFGRVVDFQPTGEGADGGKSAMDIVYGFKTFDATRFSAQISAASKILKVTIMNKRAHDYKTTAVAATTDTPMNKPMNKSEMMSNGEPRPPAANGSFDLLPQGSSQN